MDFGHLRDQQLICSAFTRAGHVYKHWLCISFNPLIMVVPVEILNDHLTRPQDFRKALQIAEAAGGGSAGAERCAIGLMTVTMNLALASLV
jgi:hypothetical protein